MKQSTFRISDIHGHHEALKRALNYIEKLNRGNIVYFLGDYIDRGPKSRETLELVKHYVESNEGSVALRGNHDQMLLDFVNKGDNLWVANDYKCLTMKSLLPSTGMGYVSASGMYLELFTKEIGNERIKDALNKECAELLDWINSLPLTHETDTEILVHAGIDYFEEDWKNTSDETLIWAYPPDLETPNNTGKTVVVGHNQAYELRARHAPSDYGIFYNQPNNTYYIDGATPISQTVNVLELTADGKYIEHNCI